MKIYPFKIPKKPLENIVVQEDHSLTFFDKLHQHEEIQISHIVAGKGKLVVGNKVHSFEPGDTFAIGSTIPHLFKSRVSNGKSKMISLFFLHDAFGKHFFDLPEMKQVAPFFDRINFGMHLKSDSCTIHEKLKMIKSLNKYELFLRLLDILESFTETDTLLLSNYPYPKSLSTHHGKRLQLIFDYVMKNFQYEIKLTTIAELIHMSPNAFCRFFKQRSNKSFFTFVTEVRIEHACQLLLEEKEMTKAEIALLSGFNTISNFNKHFKYVKGVSPSKYQEKMSLN